VDADAEHQENDADFRDLLCEAGVGDEARSKGADDNAGNQVADQRGQTETCGKKTEQQRERDCGCDRENQCSVVGQIGPLLHREFVSECNIERKRLGARA
jgi:hypothetical protein